MKYLPLFIAVLVIGTPFAASAATFPPVCSMLTQTANNEFWPLINNKLYLLATAGEPITLIWGAANATSAYNDQGTPIGFTGVQTITPTRTTTYTFHFDSGSARTTCTVTAVILGTVGQASNASVGPTTNATTVVNPQTTTTITTPTASTSTPSTASFAVGEIPFLTGGTATPGATVAVQYLELINKRNQQTTLPGVWLRQNGTAPVSSIIGFTTVDDKALFRTSTGGIEGSTPFQNGLAFIPLNAGFTPGQLRIFTIKAQISKNLTTNFGTAYGTTLKLDTDSIDTTGQIIGQLPVRGTTWTLQATN